MTPAELADAVLAAVRHAVAAGDLTLATVPDSVVVERPKVREHGDYATNAALQLAKPAGRPPREVAEVIARRLREHEGIADVEIAGPGFLNLRLAATALGEMAERIVGLGAAYGTSTAQAGTRVNLEFVSANPTGPVHLGGVRWAAVGDALARIWAAAGADVTREYYFNDAGRQIDLFAASLYAVATGGRIPDDGYQGAYLAEIAQQVADAHPGLLDEPEEKAVEVFRRDGVELMLRQIKDSLAGFGVHFDVWFSERALHESGGVAHAVERLREHGHVYEFDDAVWLRTTDFGDDKDRVLVRSGGAPTYFAADAAYYLDKRERGFDKVVIMLGADHHGYIGRMRALAACFGDDPDRTLELLIGQMVNLVRGGEPIRMSKRAGNIVTLEDVVEAVGVDAARYTLARSSTDSPIDLDIELVTRQRRENPVFYVQYAHARISKVLRDAAALGLSPDGADVALLDDEKETELLRALGEFPRIVASAAELRAPHRVARYLEELAGALHRFYDECRVLPRGDEEPTPTVYARLLLSAATRVVLANGLGLLGVSAPERM